MAIVLYLHGFASSPASEKIRRLREMLEPDITFLTPDLNTPSFEALDFESMVRKALDTIAGRPVDAIVGSSLGALVGLEVTARRAKAPLVLIAPALGVASRWKDYLPDDDPVNLWHHGFGREMPIHRQFFEDLAKREPDRDPPAVPVAIVAGTSDESVPYHFIEDGWRRWVGSGRLVTGSRLVTIGGADHSLLSYVSDIGAQIRWAVARRVL